MIKIKVDGSVVSVQETTALYCGAQDVYTCSFTFDTSWERFSKSAVFRVNGKTVTRLLDENGECVLPWELLVRSNIGQDIEVGMYGVSSDAEILTSVWDSIGLVREGSELGNDAREPSAGVYEQVMANVQRVDEKVDNYNTEVQTQVQRAESAAAVALDSAESATESAAVAESSAATADSAKDVVLNALNNVPAGSTVIVNDLTTGGTSAALSAEMGKVLGCRPNPKLLDNWYFGNPVNQRGQTEYTSRGYTIDRWILEASTQLAVLSDCVRLTGLNQISQFFEKPVTGEVTVSLLFKNRSGASLKILTNNGTTPVLRAESAETSGLVSATFDAGSMTELLLGFRVYGDNAADLIAAKLELGSVQTLAHQDADGNWVLNEIPDYSEELAKCQRYQLPGLITVGAYFISTNGIRVFVPTPVTMRTTPEISGAWEVVNAINGSVVEGFSIASKKAYASGVEIVLAKASHGLTKTHFNLMSGAFFDANL